MIRRSISAKLGRCSFCMQASLKGALAGWLAFFTVRWLAPNAHLSWPAATVAAGLTVLWTGHIVAFAARRVGRGEQAAGVPRDPAVTRRRALGALSAAAAAVVLSLPAILPERAFARLCEQECYRKFGECMAAHRGSEAGMTICRHRAEACRRACGF